MEQNQLTCEKLMEAAEIMAKGARLIAENVGPAFDHAAAELRKLQEAMAELPLTPGTPVTVRRISRETVSGVVLSGPIPHLRHIGEFYLIGGMPQGPEPWWRGSGRKSRERLEWEHAQGALGMYERAEIRTA